MISIVDRILDWVGSAGPGARRVRKQYFGWFVAAILFSILCHILLVLALVLSAIYNIQSIAGFIALVAPASLSGITYYAARAFSSGNYSSIVNWRQAVRIFSLLVILGTLIIGVLFIQKPLVNPFATKLLYVFFIFLYVYSGFHGWEPGKMKAAIDRSERVHDLQEPGTVNPHQILHIDSLQKFVFLTILNAIIAMAVGWGFGLGIGASVFFGLPAYYELMMRFSQGEFDHT